VRRKESARRAFTFQAMDSGCAKSLYHVRGKGSAHRAFTFQAMDYGITHRSRDVCGGEAANDFAFAKSLYHKNRFLKILYYQNLWNDRSS